MNILLVYFVYGLAFFSMGLSMLIESRRSQLLIETRVLRPLAFFGFIHGFHEWLEMALLAQAMLGLTAAEAVQWLRLGLLALSFIFLFSYGFQVLRPANHRSLPGNLLFGAAVFCVYLALLFLVTRMQPGGGVGLRVYADVLARYSLAVPGAALAALALERRAQQTGAQGRSRLSICLRVAACGFALYSLTQLFVPPVDLFPARSINTTLFASLTGIPIQVVRAALAVAITLSLLYASQALEDERQQAFLAAQNARLEALEQIQRDLLEREALRRELLRHTVIAQEDERARIARELHDETAQYLTAMRLDLSTLQNILPPSPQASGLLDRLQCTSRQMFQGIYRMVHDLRPAQLDDLGLVAALKHLADETGRRSSLQVTLEVTGPRLRLDPLVETVFFRVAQEALSNVARHAHCDRACIQLHFSPPGASLRIIDRGVGFDTAERQSPPHGWGLAGMRERAESVGGQLRLQSAPGQGTQVEITVPQAIARDSVSQEAFREYHTLDVGRRS